jgi:hypothetical protein
MRPEQPIVYSVLIVILPALEYLEHKYGRQPLK